MFHHVSGPCDQLLIHVGLALGRKHLYLYPGQSLHQKKAEAWCFQLQASLNFKIMSCSNMTSKRQCKLKRLESIASATSDERKLSPMDYRVPLLKETSKWKLVRIPGTCICCMRA